MRGMVFMLVLTFNSLIILIFYLGLVIPSSLVSPSTKLVANSSHSHGLHISVLINILFNAASVIFL